MADLSAIVPGTLVELVPLVRRITAPNPGAMTGPGTNSYIVGRDALALIDPGPEIDSHLAALLDAVGSRLKWILCTHTHRDHSPLAAQLKAATGAELFGFGAVPDDGRQDIAFAPDRSLADGDVVDCGEFQLRAVHTPGHASNHLCYLFDSRKLLFTGDHVMQGSTVVISPPDGDMQAYLASLERLLALDIAAFAPGHGRLIDTPHDEVRRLVAHRLKREEKVFRAFECKNPASLDELVAIVYDDVPERMHPVARRSLHAHLIKLARENRLREAGGHWKRA
ncbi:MAG: MBL fold metallo-hydrolase [Betaproteobacteria bacterium]|nr:MBL fold metallo-hydrolase [Betaproteobacteria bacterium]